ncbi:MAG: hypothetical protein KKC80_02910 [Candidatus Margulisbacteria bacterium]|nr:hypothetical protein [Candidatus Margulisiibacteriota bacterium]MBU1616815.1 hypothetical protein [Candidatus Margulisiibacteriota bacterium]MBU1867808.1 hypothetical protein [Candidatus Margulisiibacteriota bacterium]
MKKKTKKSPKKSAAKKKITKKTVKPKGPKVIGKIIHIYDKISVAIIKVQSPLKVGDYIQIKGKTTDFKQKVDSIQINHKNVPMVNKGAEIGLKVGSQVRENDIVYAAEPETHLTVQPASQLPMTTIKPISFQQPKPGFIAKPAVSPKPTEQSKPVMPPPTKPNNPYDSTKFLKF